MNTNEAPEALLIALDAAPDEQTRNSIIMAAPTSVRKDLSAFLIYHAFNKKVCAEIAAEAKAFEAFTRSLDGAYSDAARLALISSKDPTFIAEWRWQLTASSDDWRRRYLAMVTNSDDE